ncbi:MAG: hypothetical protein K2V38_03890 [Gemmataceae bacterium]|nr:hypothetical protein [Gemmataceae bacterium]
MTEPTRLAKAATRLTKATAGLAEPTAGLTKATAGLAEPTATETTATLVTAGLTEATPTEPAARLTKATAGLTEPAAGLAESAAPETTAALVTAGLAEATPTEPALPHPARRLLEYKPALAVGLNRGDPRLLEPAALTAGVAVPITSATLAELGGGEVRVEHHHQAHRAGERDELSGVCEQLRQHGGVPKNGENMSMVIVTRERPSSHA